MSDEWTTTRLKAKELENLRQLKATIQAAISKTVTLGEAITYALNHVKTGWFESVDVSKLASSIEIDVNSVKLGYYPPRITFNFSLDNRNLQELSLQQFTCKAWTSAIVEELGEETVLGKVKFGPVQKNVIKVLFDLSFPTIEVLDQLSASADIDLETRGIAYFSIGDTAPAIIIRKYNCHGSLSSSSWRRHMDGWKKKYPRTFKCFIQ